MIRILTLTLALLVAVTSQQMAVARSLMMDAQGQVVLCTGQGVMTVTLDRSGEPMDPVQICPDCALTLMVALAAPDLPEPQLIHMQTLTQSAVPALQTPVIPKLSQARGPPALV